MEILQPDSWQEALDLKASHPHARPIAGGTDLMVELNFDRARPEAILDLTRIAELREWERADGSMLLGAGVTYTQVVERLAGELPGLAIASRTVGSPQIRNRGTIGGNLATASPAGDALPPLYASDASVELASVSGGTRWLPVAELLIVGPKQTVMRDDELISRVRVVVADGPQQFAKVGPRNAMVIAICSLSVHLSPARRAVCACIGSAGPTPLRAPEAEEFIAGELDWDGCGALSDGALTRFGELVAGAARPIDDVRGSGDYRRHALAVLARRTLGWTWDEWSGAA